MLRSRVIRTILFWGRRTRVAVAEPCVKMVKQVVPRYLRLNRLTQFNGAAIQHDLLGNRLQDGRYLYRWDALNRLVGMQAYQASGRFKVVGDAWRFVYRADGLRVVREKVSQEAVADGGGEGGGSSRTEYLYDGQMPVCEQEFAGSTLRTTRVNFLGARGIEAVVTVDHTRGNQVALRWLLYDGHGNLVRMMSPNYTLSAFQWRGVWGEVQGSLGTGRGYCANLGHPEDETGLVYMRARYYEPATGRFLSEDPARDGVNWYLYAEGNPVQGVDFSGTRTYIDLGGGWLIAIDGHPGDPVADMHMWYKGKRIGSIWNSGTWKHMWNELSKNKAKDLIERLEAHESKRVRGWTKVLRRAGYSSVVIYFQQDPLDFIAIMFDIRGDHETAALIDQINRML